jgi:hypothetical protein
MTRRLPTPFLMLAMSLALASAATAQRRPAIAIMPAQHSQPDARSAENVTRGLVDRFEAEQYRVVPMERSGELFRRMGLDRRPNVSDAQILRFGRRLGADLVARPQLLAVRHWEKRTTEVGEPAGARAVVYLRVLSVRSGQPLYTRQIAYTFTTDSPDTETPVLPPSEARAAADEVSRSYFERVAGSRQELRSPSRR